MRVVLATLIAALAAAFLAPGAARAATLPRVRHQLLGWHLRPRPLFPSHLPAGFHGTNITLDRFSGADFDVTLARPDCSGTNFCVYYRRLSWAALDSILHDSATTYVQPLRIGTRSGYAVETGHAGAPSLFAWHEQGRTYMAVERYVGLNKAIQDLTPLVESLRPLATSPGRAGDSIAISGPANVSAGSSVTFRIHGHTARRNEHLAMILDTSGCAATLMREEQSATIAGRVVRVKVGPRVHWSLTVDHSAAGQHNVCAYLYHRSRQRLITDRDARLHYVTNAPTL